ELADDADEQLHQDDLDALFAGGASDAEAHLEAAKIEEPAAPDDGNEKLDQNSLDDLFASATQTVEMPARKTLVEDSADAAEEVDYNKGSIDQDELDFIFAHPDANHAPQEEIHARQMTMEETLLHIDIVEGDFGDGIIDQDELDDLFS
ncbi:MAG: hypothetical protein HRT89_23455, partial [Lentisphaeria bacterium]|nr:hypothetical protein [Lentisphaeria bacterium]